MNTLMSTLLGNHRYWDVEPLVLVVDDEPSIRLLVRRWLEHWGFRVKEACNATEAFELMKVEPASVIVCDVAMPGESGVWLVQQVCGQWPATAIIMATGVGSIETILECKRAGAVDYVLKPFGRELLHQALRRAETALPCA